LIKRTNNRPILIVGLPRSGTTWQFNVISQAKKLHTIFEPDNRKINPYSHYYLENNHRFPVDYGNNELYMKYLWLNIFQGAWSEGIINRILKYLYLRKNDSIEYYIQKYCEFKIPENNLIRFLKNNFYNLVFPNKFLIYLFEFFTKIKLKNKTPLIKSVHCIRQLSWIHQNYNPKIIIITRKIPNLIASFLRLKMPDSIRGITASSTFKKEVDNIFKNDNEKNDFILHSIIIQTCELLTTLLSFHNSNDDAILINHEKVCENPILHYKFLYKKLDLKWNNTIEKYIENENRNGSGFIPQRKSESEQIRFKDQLSSSQLNLIKKYALVYKLDNYL
jgi:hypothetical protein